MASTADSALAEEPNCHDIPGELVALQPITSYTRQPSKKSQGSALSGSRTDSPQRSRERERRSFKKVKRAVTQSIADFFLLPEDTEDQDYVTEKWRNRSCILHSNKLIGGTVREDSEPTVCYSTDTVDGDSVFFSDSFRRTPGTAGPHDPLSLGRPTQRQMSRNSRVQAPSRQISRMSTASSSRRSGRQLQRRISRKDSVVKMAYDGMKDWVHGRSESRRSKRKPEPHSRSFAPASISDLPDDLMDTLKSPGTASILTADDSVLDEVFFDTPTPTCGYSPYRPGLLEPDTAGTLAPIIEKSPMPSDPTIEAGSRSDAPGLDIGDLTMQLESAKSRADSEEISIPVIGPMVPEYMRELLPSEETGPTKSGWRFSSQPSKPPAVKLTAAVAEKEPEDQTDLNLDAFKEAFLDNADRREIGKGFVGKLFDRDYDLERMDSHIRQQMESMDDHRPYFTYWVTFVQVVVFIIAVSVYSIAPVSFEEVHIEDEVRTHNFAIERVTHSEIANFWIGPRQADLIHLGAKYSPCMRADENVVKAIQSDHVKEQRTACCVRNDGSGCIQNTEAKCSAVLSTWYNWTAEKPGPGEPQRLSGSVCGQDPRYCKNPPSQGVFQWKDDITKWPICKKGLTSQAEPHMACEVVGRPCCVGIQGECLITTREYCDFRRGYFHEEATLCSQVSCMEEICGMIHFHKPTNPDQIYRLWISLFLHGGLLQLVFTVLFQFIIMRDMEKLAGWLRIAIIYFVSGIAGSLGSAIFLPYHVEAGPAGAQFGILAMLLAEVIQNWFILKHPVRALLKLVAVIVVLFVFGLLPYIDNYAHLFGLIFGFLLSFALMPYINFNKCDRKGKIIGIVVCLLTVIGLFSLLVVLFYVIPIYHCPYCHYFNCIPFTANFCKNMEIKIGREHSSAL